MRKNNLLKALAVLAVCCVGGGAVALGSNVSASATETGKVATTELLAMNGASIRFKKASEAEDKSGIRFETRIKTADWADAGITEVGVLFLPESEGVADDLSIGTTGAWKEVVYGGTENRDGRFTVTETVGETTVEYYAFRAYLYGLPESEYTNGIQARAYAVAGGETYYTTETQTRSIAWVASEAMKDTKTEKTGDYIYEVSEGVYSPYSTEERTSLGGYLENASAPVITAPEALQLKYHYGDTIDLTGFKATDWLGDAVTLSYSVTAGGKEVAVSNGTFKVEGYSDYTAVLTAMDGSGVTTTATYTFYVYQANEFAYFNSAATLAEEVQTAGGLTAEYSETYAKEGNGSLKIGTDGGGTIGLKFLNTANVDWENVNGLTFYVYNPTDYEYRISVAGFTPAAGAGLSGSLRINAWAKPGEWTKVAVSAADIVTSLNGEDNLFGILMECLYNDDDTSNTTGNNQSQEWLGMELYLDAFTIDAEYSWDQTLIGSTTAVINVKTGLEEITVDGENKTATYMNPNSTYARPYVMFADADIAWGENNKLTFKAVNNTAYAMVFAVTTHTSYDFSQAATIISYVNLLAGDTDEIVVYKDEIPAGSYLGFSLSCDLNGGNAEPHKTQRNSIRIHLYDFTFTTSEKVVPNSDDYLWAQTISNSQSLSFVDTDVTVEGSEYSLHYRSNRDQGWPWMLFGKKISNVKSLTFQVYNPVETVAEGYNAPYLYINACSYDETTGTATKIATLLKDVRLESGKGWKTVTLDTSAIKGGFYLSLGSQGNNVSGDKVDPQYFYNGLYFDGFVEEGYTAAELDEMWSTGKTGHIQGTLSPIQNTNETYVKDGSYSLQLKPAGTWNKASINQAENIDWTTVASLTFWVYNPNSWDVVFGVGSYASHVAYKGTWTKVTITDFSTIGDANNKLIIGIAHTVSLTVEGVTYTNPTSGAADGKWAEILTNGLYFDAFEVVYK
ncbi:MAG: hypothetical protein IJX87_00940 [Clostridia bacterium]|nr:hypothetical protein [Clostridia bacterium]